MFIKVTSGKLRNGLTAANYGGNIIIKIGEVMTQVKIKAQLGYFGDKDEINATCDSIENAIAHYVHKDINIGTERDKKLFCCNIIVDGIQYNWNSRHKNITNEEHQNNLDMIEVRTQQRHAKNKAQVGDYVVIDKELKRIAMIYADGDFQPCACDSGSFYLHKGGTSEMSGGLDARAGNLAEYKTDGQRLARFWFFSDNYATGANGIYFKIPVNVWVKSSDIEAV